MPSMTGDAFVHWRCFQSQDYRSFESLPLLRNVDNEKNDLGAEKSAARQS